MKHRLRRKILYILLLLLDKIVLLVPFRLNIELGKFAGFLAYLFLPRYTGVAKENLKLAFKGEKTSAQINKITLDLFKNIGMNAAEVLNMPKIKKNLDKNIYGVGFEKIDAALANGKGIIMLSAHIGNWELLPLYFVAKGYTTNVIARRVYYQKYDKWVELLRESTGANIIFRDESPKKILRALHNNEVLGILPDQDIDSVESIFVNFFGRPAHTPTAPVQIAVKMSSPMLPCFIIRENHRHKIIVEDPIDLQITGNKAEDVIKNTQAWSSLLESYIRKYPEQWMWVHRRWKTRPKNSS